MIYFSIEAPQSLFGLVHFKLTLSLSYSVISGVPGWDGSSAKEKINVLRGIQLRRSVILICK
jgi:hypothetical protein